jgi:hypothetical protein
VVSDAPPEAVEFDARAHHVARRQIEVEADRQMLGLQQLKLQRNDQSVLRATRAQSDQAFTAFEHRAAGQCLQAIEVGLLYAPSGERMYPTYSRKNGRKYHYYVSKSEARFGAPGKSYERLPAPEIEGAVVAQIRTVLTSPETVASVVRHIQRNGAQIDEATTVMAMGRLNNVWDQLFPVERHRIANLMIERIDLVHAGEVQGIKVKWREVGWNALIAEFAPDSIGAELLEVEA